MIKKVFLSVILAFLLTTVGCHTRHPIVTPTAVVAEKIDGQPRNIILIGWDGAQRDHVKECLERDELPNLKKLIQEGNFVEMDIEGTTDTAAGWSQILTGYYPEVTGVYSDSRYQPIPKGLSIFERLEKHFGSDNFVTAAVIGKKERYMGIDPPSPYYNTYAALEVWEYGLIENKKVGTRVIELLEKYKDKPFFFFVHFAEVDQKGHQFGENSKQYNDALISCDKWTGEIMDKLKKMNLYDKTLIYVTADHGFDETSTSSVESGEKSHKNAPYVFLATNDKKVMRNGLRQDIAPTILERFGLDLKKIEPPLDGFTLTKPCDRPKPKLGTRRASLRFAQGQACVMS